MNYGTTRTSGAGGYARGEEFGGGRGVDSDDWEHNVARSNKYAVSSGMQDAYRCVEFGERRRIRRNTAVYTIQTKNMQYLMQAN